MAPLELHWSLQADYPILTYLAALPLIGGLSLLVIRRIQGVAGGALALALAELLLAADLYRHFDPQLPALQLAEWRDLLGLMDYHVGVTGQEPKVLLGLALIGLLLAGVGASSRRWNGPSFATLFLSQGIAVLLIVTRW